MKFQNDKTLDKFANMDLNEYAGYAVGIVNGKIAFKDKNPKKVLDKLFSKNNKNKNVAIICVPNTKVAMAIWKIYF